MAYNIDVPKPNVADAVEILVDSVANPKFLSWEVKEAVAKMKADIATVKDNPQTVLLEVHNLPLIPVVSAMHPGECASWEIRAAMTAMKPDSRSVHHHPKTVRTQAACMGAAISLCITWPLLAVSVPHAVWPGCTDAYTHLSSAKTPFPAPHDMFLAYRYFQQGSA